MDFKEFYKLIDGALTKEKTDVIPSSENYANFIFNRYLSFYHPQIAIYIAKTSNRTNWLPCSDEEQMSWLGMKALLPKLPKAFIQYVKKPSVVAAQELNVSEEVIKEEAMFNECSKREIRDLIFNYAKRS